MLYINGHPTGNELEAIRALAVHVAALLPEAIREMGDAECPEHPDHARALASYRELAPILRALRYQLATAWPDADPSGVWDTYADTHERRDDDKATRAQAECLLDGVCAEHIGGQVPAGALAEPDEDNIISAPTIDALELAESIGTTDGTISRT
mgnify:CR=1 FL=1